MNLDIAFNIITGIFKHSFLQWVNVINPFIIIGSENQFVNGTDCIIIFVIILIRMIMIAVVVVVVPSLFVCAPSCCDCFCVS